MNRTLIMRERELKLLKNYKNYKFILKQFNKEGNDKRPRECIYVTVVCKGAVTVDSSVVIFIYSYI